MGGRLDTNLRMSLLLELLSIEFVMEVLGLCISCDPFRLIHLR